MKINRLKLIELIDKEIKRLHNQADRTFQQDCDTAQRRAKQYVERTSVAWERFAQNIMGAVMQGNPVTLDIVPAELSSGSRPFVNVYEVVSVKRRPPNTTTLENLRVVLEISTDEEVSTHSLEKQGFGLGRVLRGD